MLVHGEYCKSCMCSAEFIEDYNGPPVEQICDPFSDSYAMKLGEHWSEQVPYEADDETRVKALVNLLRKANGLHPDAIPVQDREPFPFLYSRAIYG